MMLLPIYSANTGGTAFPICLATSTLFPVKEKSIGKVCNNAPSLSDILLSCTGCPNFPLVKLSNLAVIVGGVIEDQIALTGVRGTGGCHSPLAREHHSGAVLFEDGAIARERDPRFDRSISQILVAGGGDDSRASDVAYVRSIAEQDLAR